MHWELWLAQQKIGRALGTALRLAAGAALIWALAIAYGLWSTRAALADAQSAFVARQKQFTEMTASLPVKRREAAQAERLRTAMPGGAGGTEFTAELHRLAGAAGAEVRAARIGSGDPAAPAQAAANPAPAQNSATAVTPAAPGVTAVAPDPAGAGNWKSVRFECSITGTFDALTGFLERLVTLSRVVEIKTMQVTRGGESARTGRLQMRLTGAVSGLQER